MPSPKVLVVVFDGLRLVHATPNRAPNIAGFAAAGVRLPNTGSAFPSETRSWTPRWATRTGRSRRRWRIRSWR